MAYIEIPDRILRRLLDAAEVKGLSLVEFLTQLAAENDDDRLARQKKSVDALIAFGEELGSKNLPSGHEVDISRESTSPDRE